MLRSSSRQVMPYSCFSLVSPFFPHTHTLSLSLSHSPTPPPPRPAFIPPPPSDCVRSIDLLVGSIPASYSKKAKKNNNNNNKMLYHRIVFLQRNRSLLCDHSHLRLKHLGKKSKTINCALLLSPPLVHSFLTTPQLPSTPPHILPHSRDYQHLLFSCPVFVWRVSPFFC